MVHKNSYYDIPTVLEFENMTAVKVAGITNPSKAARRAISMKQVGARKIRRGTFFSSMGAEVKQLLENIRKEGLRKKILEKQQKSKLRLGAVQRKTPIQAPPVSIQESGGGKWGWVPSIFKRRKI